MNTFRNPHGDAVPKKLELARSTEQKQSQLKRLLDFHARNAEAAPAALERLKGVVIENDNERARVLARSDHEGAVELPRRRMRDRHTTHPPR